MSVIDGGMRAVIFNDFVLFPCSLVSCLRVWSLCAPTNASLQVHIAFQQAHFSLNHDACVGPRTVALALVWVWCSLLAQCVDITDVGSGVVAWSFLPDISNRHQHPHLPCPFLSISLFYIFFLCLVSFFVFRLLLPHLFISHSPFFSLFSSPHLQKKQINK